MCQPMPASPSSRTESGVSVSTASRAIKIKSPTEGISRRTQPRGELLSGKLLEPAAIRLNLIEWGDERQDDTSCGNRGGRLRWPHGGSRPGVRARAHPCYRPDATPDPPRGA